MPKARHSVLLVFPHLDEAVLYLSPNAQLTTMSDEDKQSLIRKASAEQKVTILVGKVSDKPQGKVS